MLKTDIKFNHVDKHGDIKQYNILDKININNKNYIIYEEDKRKDIYASLYEIIDDKIKLIEITDEKDYDLIDKYLEKL